MRNCTGRNDWGTGGRTEASHMCASKRRDDIGGSDEGWCLSLKWIKAKISGVILKAELQTSRRLAVSIRHPKIRRWHKHKQLQTHLGCSDAFHFPPPTPHPPFRYSRMRSTLRRARGNKWGFWNEISGGSDQVLRLLRWAGPVSDQFRLLVWENSGRLYVTAQLCVVAMASISDTLLQRLHDLGGTVTSESNACAHTHTHTHCCRVCLFEGRTVFSFIQNFFHPSISYYCFSCPQGRRGCWSQFQLSLGWRWGSLLAECKALVGCLAPYCQPIDL